jgi:succinylarginine dihydrolase
MKTYTLASTEEDLQLGRITVKEKFLFSKYIKLRDEMSKVSDELYDYLDKQFSDRISLADLEDLKVLREELRWVPESVAKTLMFRSILMREDLLTTKF